MTQIKITREAIVTAAMSLLNTPFRHQGRDAVTGIDCIGLPLVVGEMIGYPHLADVKGYRRTPSANVIREMLRTNCDEIDKREVGIGDIYLMRMGGVKPRHVAIKLTDTLNLAKGVEPMLIHAKGIGTKGKVVIEPVRQWANDIVCGFRLRGVV